MLTTLTTFQNKIQNIKKLPVDLIDFDPGTGKFLRRLVLLSGHTSAINEGSRRGEAGAVHLTEGYQIQKHDQRQHRSGYDFGSIFNFRSVFEYFTLLIPRIAAVLGNRKYTIPTSTNITFLFPDSPSPVVVSLTPSNKSSSGKPPGPPRPRFSESEVKAMTSKKYMDALVVPTLLKAMAAVNKQVSDIHRYQKERN